MAIDEVKGVVLDEETMRWLGAHTFEVAIRIDGNRVMTFTIGELLGAVGAAREVLVRDVMTGGAKTHRTIFTGDDDAPWAVAVGARVLS